MNMAWFKKYHLILFLTAAACIPQFILFNTLPVIFVNDSVWYLDLTRYFARGGFFPDYYAFLKPVQCMINYPLGYPLFLDLCRLCGPTFYWGRSIVLCQHLLSLCSVLLLFLIGHRTGRKLEGFGAALAYALYMPRIIYIQAIMAETLFIFLTLLSIYIFFGILVGKNGKRAGIFLGAVSAFAMLTKPLAILSAGVFLIYLLMSPVSKKVIWCFVISFSIAVFSNFLYNRHFYGQMVLTTTSGSHLANRVFAFDGLIDKDNPETREIILKCSKSGLSYRFPDVWWDYLRALRSCGSSPQEADQLIMKAALAGIRSQPFVYIKHTWTAFSKNIVEEDHWLDKRLFMTKDDYMRYLQYFQTGSLHSRKYLPPAEFASRRKVLKIIAVDYPQGPWHELGIRWLNSFDSRTLKWRGCVGWVIMFSFLYGLLARDRILFFITVFTVVNLLLVSLTEYPYPRYFESFVPLAMLTVFLSLSKYLITNACPWLGSIFRP
jgi:hypothetical protein